MHRCLPKPEICQSWKTPTSWIVGSSGVRRLLHLQHPKVGLWEWALGLGEVNLQQMAMQALETETAMYIVSKTVVAIHLMADIAMACLHHHRKKNEDGHGKDTEMTDQIQDSPPGLRRQIILVMMARENVRMITGLDPVI
jgi:hypothetical protein